MRPLFGAIGLAALHRLARADTLLAFDLDGTLAPLVSRPADAAVSGRTARRLKALTHAWPVAVITGRRVDDAQARLGFEPRYLFGNHGAEQRGGTVADPLHRQLSSCRDFLRDHALALQARRIAVEDKGLSMALHYRNAVDPCAAPLWLDELLRSLPAGLLAQTHGHQVLNLTPRDAPDKGDALLTILRDCGATTALVIGDDSNDECAFDKAPSGSLSVRIGPRGVATRAHFRLARQSQVDALLLRLLDLRR